MINVTSYIVEKLNLSLTTNEFFLENIKLSQKDLELISKGIKKTKSLGSIVIKNCGLITVPDFVWICPNLMILDLKDNLISQIDINLCEDPKLVILNLSNNPLLKIKNIKNLMSLKILLLNNTLLNKIPENWSKLSLRVLELSNHKLIKPYNDIKNLPKTTYKLVLNNGVCKNWELSVGHLSGLELLDVSNNDISGLDENITLCENLKVLNLSNNNLNCLPEKLFQMKNLRQFNYSNNPVFIKKTNSKSIL